MNCNEGAPVEGLDSCAGEKVVFLEDGDELQIFGNRPGLFGCDRVEFGFEVDGDLVVADAFYEGEDFFEGLNFGAGEEVLLGMICELNGTAIECLDILDMEEEIDEGD